MLVILACAVHLPFLNHPFFLDDHIWYRFALNHSWSEVFARALWQGEGQHYSPLAQLLILAPLKLTGGSFIGTYLFGWVIHTVAALSVYRFCRHFFSDRFGAVAAACLWALHPLQVLPVHFVTAYFVPAGIACALNAMVAMSRHTAAGSRGDLAQALVLALGAYGLSEFFILVPGYYVLLRVLVTGQRIFPALAGAFKLVLPAFLIIGGWLAFASGESHLTGKIAVLGYSATQYLANWSALASWAVSRLVVPWDPVYVKNIPLHAPAAVYWMGLGIVGGMSAAVVVFLRGISPAVRVAVGWMLLGLAPTLVTCFVHAASGMVFELHWLGLALVPCYALPALVCTDISRRRTPAKAVMAAMILILPLTALTLREVAFWQDEERYSTRWLAVSPGNHLALISLAQQQERRGDIDAALRSVDLMSTTTAIPRHIVELMRGQILLRAGRPSEAARHFEAALRHKPDLSDARVGLRQARAALPLP
ncbi:MAG: hypothetical protein KC897_00500 [Candidatus Omnitrophica bacterium]|nr:hypothetical protein [Candidatus Omnitrophota bacterium]MCB9721514.1 hypothetical protein [Candidatus Omnitrophota bacterium]